jgi:hypothetical protein
MVPTPKARVDGLAVFELHQEHTPPVEGETRGRTPRVVSARQRARIARQTAVVRDSQTAGALKRWLAAQAAEADRLAIREDLAQAGLL